MTEQGPDADGTPAPPGDAPEGPPSAPPPEVPDAAPAPDRDRDAVRRRRVRTAILAVVGAAVVVAAIVLIVRGAGDRRGAADPAGGSSVAGSGAAIRAPEGPSLSAAPDGVRLTGVVVDGLGAPVVGAEVAVELERGAADAALAPAPPTSPVIDAPAADAGAPAARVVVAAPTGADGRFSVAGLAPGRYRLRVTGPGLLPAEVRFVPVPSDATRIVVARQVSIEGTVTDGGKPAPNVIVGLRGEAIGGAIEAKTSLTGAFAFGALPEGRYQLFAYRGALAARAVRVNRLGAGPFAPVELHLEAATIVVGRVIDRDEGTGVAAAIELRPSGDDQAPRYTRSGADGVFRIEGVPNGRWIADAYAPGFLSPGGVELDAGRGVPELALTRGATIEGRVVDGDGAPIEGATVRALGAGTAGQETSALIEQDRLRRFSGRTAAPAANAGTPGADPLLLPRGELGVMVGPIPPLPPPGAPAARPAVVDPTFAALAGEPAPLPDDPLRAPVWTTGADGRFRIPGLAKGKTRVLAVAAGFAEGRSKDVAVSPGQLVTKVDVVLTPGTFVIGRVTDQHGAPVLGAQVTARPASTDDEPVALGLTTDAFTDDAGEYRLGPLVGTVDLVATAYGHGDARQRSELPAARGKVPAQHRVDFVLVIADAVLAGTLDDANGTPVAGAQLEVVGGAGDGRAAIVAADGTFSIDLLPAGTHRIRIRHPDYPIHELDATASTGGKERARLRLPLGGGVEGAVLDAFSGAPLTGITVTGVGPGRAVAEAATDKRGQWKLAPLAPGAWKVSVKLAGYLPLVRELDVPVARTAGGTTLRDIRLELERGALVGGTVRDARGQRLAGVPVVVRRADGTGPTTEGTTDAEGEFRIRDCPTGDLEVIATVGDRRGVTAVTVRPGGEVLGLAIDVR